MKGHSRLLHYIHKNVDIQMLKQSQKLPVFVAFLQNFKLSNVKTTTYFDRIPIFLCGVFYKGPHLARLTVLFYNS